jgi:tRNA A37 methylthiotransferase MiaB
MKPINLFSKKVYVEVVHGACNRRLLDGQRIASYFEANGCEVVTKAHDADVLFLITCGVSVERESSSLRRIHSLKKLNGELIVSGCLPAINRQKVLSLHKGVSIPTSEIGKIDEYFQSPAQVKLLELGDANRYYLPSTKKFGSNFFNVAVAKLASLGRLPLRYTLKKEIIRLVGKVFPKRDVQETTPYPIRISWGCSQKCSYCGIRSAVGQFHSKPLETCLAEFEYGLNSGHKEFELIADDVGAYGNDIGGTFPELLKSLFDIPGNYTMQIWNLSPVWFVKRQDAFLDVLRKGKITGIHYPVQSGSGRVLKAMRRYSDANKIRESVNLMKESCPNLTITTDIIVGYPGETDEDISETIDLLRKSRFDSVHIFLYNEVPAATSYTAEGKIPRGAAIQRISRIEEALDDAGIDTLIMV